MPKRAVNGQDYFWLDGGAGRALLLLHGFTGSADSWAPFLETLAPLRRVIAPDILGHGRSAAPADPGRYRLERVAADLVGLMASLAITQFDILGYSMGGRLGLFMALTYPERVGRLLLESSSPGLATPPEREARRQRDEALADRIEREGITAFVDFWESLPLWASQRRLPPALLAVQRAGRLANRPVGLANSLRGMGTGAQPSLWDRLDEWQRPALLLNGGLDEKYVAINRQMAAEMPQTTVMTIPDIGHNTHLEAPHRFTTIVHDWLL